MEAVIYPQYPISTKAFDSINWDKMFEILVAYGIPLSVVNAIHVMYRDTSAVSGHT